MLKLERLFWLKVWPRGDCWEWRGNVTKAGYGYYTAYGISYRAHRLAYTWTKGWIPSGLVIDHLCNHPWCVKPSHLVTVTGRQNTLRGVGPSARNARKTHCKRGHEFTKENIYAKKAGKWREVVLRAGSGAETPAQPETEL